LFKIPSKKNREYLQETQLVLKIDKVNAIVEETFSKNMAVISGIPSWVQMYFGIASKIR
jgi:hypothetical protein